MCLNLKDFSLNVHRTRIATLMHFQSYISVVMCSRQSSLPAKYFFWKRGEMEAWQFKIEFPGSCSVQPKGWTHLPKRGLCMELAWYHKTRVSWDYQILLIIHSCDFHSVYFLISDFHRKEPWSDEDLHSQGTYTRLSPGYFYGAALFHGLLDLWNLALPLINQVTLAKSFNLFEL